MKRVYLDYCASTPASPEVVKAMAPYFSEKYGNPSSIHSFGREAEIITDEARESLANFFEVKFGEIYFTSGATEANNWMIYMAAHMPHGYEGKKPHIITSAFEHESLLELITYLRDKGAIEATIIAPSAKGLIDPRDVAAALKENTVLVSIMYVNNEVGTVQPIKEIGRMIETHKRAIPGTQHQLPVFHTDAVQAVQYYETRLPYVKVDAMTVSGHKLYGPKGVGMLIARESVWMKPLLYGGGQESSMRSGTTNVHGIVGLARACALLSDNKRKKAYITRLVRLKKRLQHGIITLFPDALFPADITQSAPHILNVLFPTIESQIMLIALDQEGIAVSAGAACSAKALKPSYVLVSMGYTREQAFRAIRFSMGRETTQSDIEAACKALERIKKKIMNNSLNFL